MVIGTWNVHTLKSDGKLKQLLSEMEKFKVDILDVSETHWNKEYNRDCLLYTSPSPRDGLLSRMPSSA